MLLASRFVWAGYRSPNPDVIGRDVVPALVILRRRPALCNRFAAYRQLTNGLPRAWRLRHRISFSIARGRGDGAKASPELDRGGTLSSRRSRGDGVGGAPT